jgi:LPS-assembly protein
MLHFLIVILLLAVPQQNDVVIEADRQEKEQNISRAMGNVIVTYQDMRIEADEATYDETTKVITAGERVLFRRGPEHLEADSITINLATKEGTLTHVTGELGPGFFVAAAQADRKEDGHYELKNATITTCDGESPGWTLALARAFVSPNKHVSAKNSIFRLESVPLFYLPYVMVPATNRERATGFLIPTTSTSTTKGRSIRESFYYAINRSADATFTGEYFTQRGPAGTIDFKAVPRADSRIELTTFFVRDRKNQGGQSLRILTYGGLPQNFRGVADMNLVSSFVFRQVFEEGFNVISSPIEHSLAFVTRNRPDSSINVLYSRTGIFFTDQPTVVLRKFPTLEASIPDRQLGNIPVYFNLGTGLSGVARRDASINTPTLVERFDLHPTVEIPVLRSDAFEWNNQFGVRETMYTHSREPKVIADALNRFSVDYSTGFVGPRLERDFSSFRHVIEPSVEYHYLTGANRYRQTIVVDDVDLITNTNEVEYALTNRFFTSREIFSWRLAQKYFFDPTFGGAITPGARNVFAPLLDLTGFAFADGKRRTSPLVSTMRMSTSPNTSTDLQVDYDTQTHLFRSAGIIGGFNRGLTSGSISYFFVHSSPIQIPNNQLRGLLTFGNELKPGMSAAFSFSYDVQRSLFQSSVAQVGYNTDCYGLSFEFSQFDVGARKESRFRFAFSLKNIGSYGTLRPRERLF